jgi:hypothetical protein
MVPENTPKPKAAVINERKGCHLKTEVETMIKTIDNINKMINHIMGQDNSNVIRKKEN